MLKIALDAGHYLGTPGRRCLKQYDPNETKEWQLNSRIAELVTALLGEYQNASVIRCDDATGATDVSLSGRCERANQGGADFFLSIHHNAGINGGKGGGITAFSYYGSAESAEWRDALYGALAAETGLVGNRSRPCAEAGYAVLKGTDMPAVLVELGFMDSATDIPVIITEAYAESCAKAIVGVLAERLGLQRNEPEATAEEPKEETNVVRFMTLADMPDYAKATIEKLVRKGILKGTGGGVLDLSEDMVRLLVILDRAGMLGE